MNQIVFLYTTVGTLEDVQNLAKEAVQKGFAACVNVTSGGQSYYMWNGQLETSSEYYLLFKTSMEKKDLLKQWVLENHPYEVPAILMGPADSTPDFVQFIEKNVL